MLLVNKLGSRAPLLSTSRAGRVLAGRSREAGSPSACFSGGPEVLPRPSQAPGTWLILGTEGACPPRDTQQPVPVRECVLSPSTAGLSTAGPSPGPCRVPGRQTTARVHPHPPALPQDHAMTSQPGGHWTAIAATTHSCREGEAF